MNEIFIKLVDYLVFSEEFRIIYFIEIHATKVKINKNNMDLDMKQNEK